METTLGVRCFDDIRVFEKKDCHAKEVVRKKQVTETEANSGFSNILLPEMSAIEDLFSASCVNSLNLQWHIK